MTVQEYYDFITTALDKKSAADSRLKGILRKIDKGTATFSDTAKYSEIMSDLLGEIFSENIMDITEPYAKEQLCKLLLKDRYADINGHLSAVQRAVDEKAGLHLRPQQTAFPFERVVQIAHSLEDPTVSDDTIKRRANSGVANVSMSFHDDYMQENAKFRNDAGLKCYINRTTDGSCCPWCSDVSGRYEYGDEPHDIYRRHDNCKCSVTYENGKQRQDVWSKRTWNTHDINPQEAKPTVLTPEQAKELEQQNLQYRGLKGNNIDAVPNQSRWNDLFNDYGIPSNAHITPQQIYENLTTSNIGKEILSYIENLPERIELDYETLKPGIYGEEYNGTIKIFIKSCENAERAARTIIHECTHRRYGIGQSQWAESVCFAQELKHKYKRDYLTISEKKRIIKAVKEGYPEHQWRKGGMIYGRRRNHN